MPLPDEPDDEVRFVPPLPPEDRLWRHPSERATTRPIVEAPPHRDRRAVAVLLAVVVVLAGLTTVAVRTDPSVTRSASATDGESVDAATSNVLHDALAPAVVQVSVERPDGRLTSTGLLVRRDGHLVTAADPLVGATSITVRVADGSSYNATIVGIDRPDDLAVLDIATTDAPTPRVDVDRRVDIGEATFVVDRNSESSRLRVTNASIDASGQRLVADDGSVMLGLLRAVLSAPRVGTTSILCAADGTVLGILTSRSPRSGSSPSTIARTAPGRSVSWATPTAWMVRVADELIGSGILHRAWMGVVSEDSTSDGVVLRSVVDAGPAASAGARAGDIVRAVDGTSLSSADELAVTVRAHRPGDRVRLTVRRDETTVDLDVVLSEQL